MVGARQEKRQKRVDVLLAVEMLSHAFNKNMQKAILIAGDDDFTPLVEELLRHGTYVEVWSDRMTNSRHLLHAADAGWRMGYEFYWQLAPPSFRKEHPLPDDASTGMEECGRTIKTGPSKGGNSISIVKLGGSFHFCTHQQGVLKSIVRASEMKVLEEFLKEKFKDDDLLPAEWKETESI